MIRRKNVFDYFFSFKKAVLINFLFIQITTMFFQRYQRKEQILVIFQDRMVQLLRLLAVLLSNLQIQAFNAKQFSGYTGMSVIKLFIK